MVIGGNWGVIGVRVRLHLQLHMKCRLRILPARFDEGVEKTDLIGPPLGVGRFENERDGVEAAVVHDHPEGFQPDFPRAERGVTIHMTAEFRFGIVQMHPPQIGKSDHSVKGIKYF